MVKESFPLVPNETEKSIHELTNAIRDKYGRYYDDLIPEDQTLWNELFRFANIEKGQSAEKREVLTESLISFLSFLESEYGSKG